MSAPINPPPVREWVAGSLPAYLSNGVIGLRVPPTPLLDGIAIINGFSGVDGDSGAEAFARAPYPLAGNVEVGDLTLQYSPERAVLQEQSYDFATGELRTRFDFDAGEVRAELDVLTFCSRTMPMLVLQEVHVTVNKACDLALSSGIDHLGVPGSMRERHTRTQGTNQEPVDGSLRWESHGGLSTCGAAYVTELRGADVEPTLDHNELKPLTTRYAFRARSGVRYRLRHVAALVPETMHSQPDLQAVRLVHGGTARGFDRLRQENAKAWEEIWLGRVELDGPARWQALADAAYFYLSTSVHSSSPASTAIFGLSYWPDYHYYRGHVMWDVEAFVIPPLVLTNPDVARTLLEYRSARLPAARHNAAMAGYRGAQFPWESSIRHGEESAPGEGAASAHEHHVSLDVAFAFSQYLHATHDWHWGREHAWHILEDVAEWVVSRGVESGRGFEIHGVNGIAERKETVDNNAFVNMAAAVALREAVILAEPLGRKAHPVWERLSRDVFLPVNGKKIILNHDSYRRNEEKGETPEAAAGLFPLTFDCPPDIEQATFEFYLGLADKYVGSPMLSALLGVYATRLGDRERALEFFERGYADFVLDPFSITTEYAPKVFPEQIVAGPFTANIGGFLTSCLYGLTGLRIADGEPETWCARPITMPKGWDGLHVERVWTRGRPATLTARHGEPHAALVVEPE